ncbi:acyl-CoA dehydrogenase family protein [Rhodococcus sp. IEGM 1351]|uniref:acyl-CoA dehydrogenase family protein n=1 Tax=Rhodococcus sp. IEGM 1351 TaxID=3047089 RepID=UPI0024B8702D|nr:acyl-CoA dehydrogenase family protein [Rhodococcus sp. IEGM 1351]MDI9941316.1 acyl-CoA dehydrogenase family protein [Rhodococcus sp. IEGM 1351]
MSTSAPRPIFDDEHEQLRDTTRRFVHTKVLPHLDKWEQDGQVDRTIYQDAAEAGLIGFSIPEEYGGAGVVDFRFNAVIGEEFARAGASTVGMGITLINDIVLPYFLELTNDQQKQRWLPGIASGEKVIAVAMTEPGAGSDLAGIRTSAKRSGDHYVVDGAKTFISNGQHADLVVVVCRTDAHPHKGLSLLVVEDGTEGFSRGRNLRKVGLHAQDTSELSFTDARVDARNLLREEGSAFYSLMGNLPQERLTIAVNAVASIEGNLARTIEYVKERRAFGQPIGSFQNSKFLLADLATQRDVARIFIDDCIRRHTAGELTAAQAAAAKLWTTELQVTVADRCVQLHGGYGYMAEYQVARDFTDARIQTIYGGTSEIMKEIVGKSLGL